MQSTFFPEDIPLNGTRPPGSDRLIMPKLRQRAAGDRQLDSPDLIEAHEIIIRWADLEANGRLARMNETQVRGEFLAEVFGKALHYTLISENKKSWQLWPEFPINGGTADGAIGQFADNVEAKPMAVVEIKGPKVNLDRDRAAGRTAVQQCREYLMDLPDCSWGIVSNIVSFRLYHHAHPRRQYEHFSLQALRDPLVFRQFYVLFERSGLLPSIVGHRARAEQLLYDTLHAQREVSDELYDIYRDNRLVLVRHLIHQKAKSIDAAIHIAQKLLDRILFIAFCEDRRLMPPELIKEAWEKYSRLEQVTNPRWRNFLNLFQSVDRGNIDANIAKFNGRLFAPDPELDDRELLEDRRTEFFTEIAGFDFDAEVQLDVLGHIFERSITDLEVLRANPQLALEPDPPKPGRRKREGVYSTPPRITQYIVERTLGPVIDEQFAALAKQYDIQNWAELPIESKFAEWTKFQTARLGFLKSLRVVDPACGSGAFLIQAFDYLEDRYDEVVTAIGRRQREGDQALRESIKTDILTKNLYGVDLSDESVEITRLALWIRTAEKGKTLADLAQNIRHGNSLVDNSKIDPLAFDWREAFADVFAGGGFHCVISNPPYVKLQNFKRQAPKIAAWLPERYRAASTGNFDMYLPFIERGIELLRPGGRMGFIAPNVWLFNEYGRGLRELIVEKRALSQFVDFKSHQVFDDATTYTALQFFTAAPQDNIAVSNASTGNLAQLREFNVAYKGLGGEAWALVDDRTQAILDRMRKGSIRLDEATENIIVGIQTSADAIYHLINAAPGKYFSDALERVVEIEDEIMKPLVSSEDASPFAIAPPSRHLLFPYSVDDRGGHLISASVLKRKFKRAWTYLGANEKMLRARESGKMDHDGWYGYNYPKNIDKQHLPKLLVPRLLYRLFAAIDRDGSFCIDNVDVGGVLLNGGWHLDFLLGLLNSRALDFAWRIGSKPFRGEYRSANKQFIAPLPVPADKDQKPLAKIAKKLTALHAARHEAVGKVHRRFVTDLPPKELIKTSPLPPNLPGRLRDFDALSMTGLLSAMENFADRKLGLEERDRWQDYLAPQLTAIQRTSNEIASLQRELDTEVYALFGLKPADIEVIEAGAPTRQ